MPSATLASVMPTWQTERYSSSFFWMAISTSARLSPSATSSATREGRTLTMANSARTKKALTASSATRAMDSAMSSKGSSAADHPPPREIRKAGDGSVMLARQRASAWALPGLPEPEPERLIRGELMVVCESK